MKKNQININISGSGTQILLFIIDDLFLKKLVEHAKSYVEFDCYELLQESNIECHHICDGIDVLHGDADVIFTINGKSEYITTIFDLDDLKSDQNYTEVVNNFFVYDDGSIKNLEGSIPEGSYAIVMENYFKYGELKTFFEVDSIPKPQDIKFEFVKLDAPSDFSDCTFKLGSSDFEYDLRLVSYLENSYYFDFFSSDYQSCRFYLASRDKNGCFEISPLNDELFK